MIEFSYQTSCDLIKEEIIISWLMDVVKTFKKGVKSINYVIADDDFVWQLNKKYLNHDTYTDIITFDYTKGDQLEGEIYISLDRVKENAIKFGELQDQVNDHSRLIKAELLRVIVHGVLHMIGYKDKTAGEKKEMRAAEDKMIEMFHVKHAKDV